MNRENLQKRKSISQHHCDMVKWVLVSDIKADYIQIEIINADSSKQFYFFPSWKQ